MLLALAAETPIESDICGPSQPQSPPVLPLEIESEDRAAVETQESGADNPNDEHDNSRVSQVLVPELDAPFETAALQNVPSSSRLSSTCSPSSEPLMGYQVFDTSGHEPATQYSGDGSVADVEAAELAILNASDTNSLHSEHQPDTNMLQQSPSGGVALKKEISFKQSWRFGAVLCIVGASLVLLVNSIVAIVAAIKWPRRYGIATLYDGDCGVVNDLSTGLHLLINVLSSVLLATSNYIMQRLAAPTAAEVNKTHAKGCSLDIGIPSLRNILFLRVAKRRVLAWWLLSLTSLPIHFFYNSTLLKTAASIDQCKFTVNPCVALEYH